MSSYRIHKVQKLPIPLDEAWAFFSSPANLKEITPAYMNFKILSDSGAEKMYEGQIITYKVHPIAGIPLFWMTEIKHVKDKECFVDHQLEGPYKIWHHEHRFRAIEGGVEMTDLVHYVLPLGWIGKLAHALFVGRQVEKIFEYRYEMLEQKFGKL